MFNRSRRRLAYWFTISMGSILVIFAAVVYFQQVQDQIRAFDEALYQKSKAFLAGVRERRPNFPLSESDPISLEDELVYVRWYSPRGQLLQSIGAAAPPRKSKKVVLGFQSLKTTNETWLRQLTLPLVRDNLLIGYFQVATELTPIQENLARTRLFLSLGVPVTLGLIGLVGWFLAGVAMQPIRQSYEQLQRFTADASHELRTPLAAILSNAQVGLLAPEGDRTQPRQRLEKIVEVSKSMSALISNLLFLARHEGRLTPEVLKSTDLVGLLQPLVDEYTEVADTQNLLFVNHLPSKSVSIKADRDLLQQAIRNLLNNAFKYTPSGGSVSLRLFTQSRCAIISVEDNGIGIPAADLPHIFERFYRVDTARSRASGGFGLGLAIAQQIIQAHGGRITAQSVEGQGATFRIELPLKS